ncbi:MAG: acylphosphatase [Chloroflexota bacterium]|nr:MAG: acylphosphatase [Chloroflexota bacterium]
MNDATENNLERLHATVEGRVQGVGFRYFVMRNAGILGLSGWARNRYNGDVEVIAEGERSRLEQLLKALHRGPSSSFVRSVDTRWEEATGEFMGFKVRRTG